MVCAVASPELITTIMSIERPCASISASVMPQVRWRADEARGAALCARAVRLMASTDCLPGSVSAYGIAGGKSRREGERAWPFGADDGGTHRRRIRFVISVKRWNLSKRPKVGIQQGPLSCTSSGRTASSIHLIGTTRSTASRHSIRNSASEQCSPPPLVHSKSRLTM